MSHLELLEKEALALSDSERAMLAAHLLASLPPVLSDDDDGLAEARRRDAELAEGAPGITWETLRKNIGR